MSIQFTVYGKPRGKQRPRYRFSRKGGYAYTPKETAVYERQIRQAYIAAGGIMLSETKPISMLIEAEYAKSKTSKKTYPTLKPDWDNIGKIVSDALNGVAYRDDAQIITAAINKRWAKDNIPKVIVAIGVVE